MQPMERDLEERAFMHDLASPVATIAFAVEMMLEELKSAESGKVDTGQLMEMTLRAHSACLKAQKLMQERRALLVRRNP